MPGALSDKHIGFLDGLRGFAALVVVVSHFANRTLVGIDAEGLLQKNPLALSFSDVQVMTLAAFGNGAGQVGVMIFFTLSAFLMFHLYASRPPTFDNVRTFYASRVARVFPLYYAVLILCFVTDQFFPFSFLSIPIDQYIGHLLFVEGKSVLWTIAPELLFYICFGVIWILTKCNVRIIVVPAIVLVLVSNYLPVVWKSYTLEFFVLGYLIYELRNSGIKFGLHRVGSFSVILFGAVLFFHLPAVHRVLFGELVLTGWQSESYLIAVFLLFFLLFESDILRKIFSSPIMVFLGKISFSVYLLHLFVLHGLLHYQLIGPDLFSLGFALLLVVGLSTISYYLIENPARRWVRKTLSAPNAPKPGPLEASVAAAPSERSRPYSNTDLH